jgi:hypothetical protein
MPTPTKTITSTPSPTKTPTRTPSPTPTNITDFLPLANKPKPPTPTRTPTRTSTPTPALFPNGDFEQGSVICQEYSSIGWPVIVQQFPPGVTAYNGTWAAWLGGDYNETTYIQQQVLVPSDHPYMSYWHWIASADICGYDVGGVLVKGTVVEAYWLCYDNNTNRWVQRVIDLRDYSGQTVSITDPHSSGSHLGCLSLTDKNFYLSQDIDYFLCFIVFLRHFPASH